MPADPKSASKKPERDWLQRQVFHWLLQSEDPVEVVHTNSERVRGVVVGTDQYTILLETEDGKACLLYKHGVSAIHGGEEFLKRTKPLLPGES